VTVIHDYGLMFPRLCISVVPLHVSEGVLMQDIMLGEFTPSYILHTRAFGTYLLGGVLFTLQKRL